MENMEIEDIKGKRLVGIWVLARSWFTMVATVISDQQIVVWLKSKLEHTDY